MNIKLDLPTTHLAEIRAMARDLESSNSGVVSGIVKVYIDSIFGVRNANKNSSVSKLHTPKPVTAAFPNSKDLGMINATTIGHSVGYMYPSVKEACEDLNLHEALVYCCLRGSRKSTGGFIFTRI